MRQETLGLAALVGVAALVVTYVTHQRRGAAGQSGGEAHEKKEVNGARQLLHDMAPTIHSLLPFTVTAARCHESDVMNAVPGVVVKKVHFIRHGEGHHNVAQKNWRAANKPGEPYWLETDPDLRYIDALLTPYGEAQARTLREKTNKMHPELLVVSPLRRATQTGLIAFEKHVKAGELKTVAHELCHELAGKHTCDCRVAKSTLQASYPEVDYSLITSEEDPFWGDGSTRETHEGLARRTAEFIQWLYSRPEQEVVVAAHSQFLFTLFNAVLVAPISEDAIWFGTAEMRSMALTFVPKQ